jgi:flagellar hook-associated protein 1 FlgK
MLNTLNVSMTGLNAAKIAVENVSNNITNENTPGYKKRVVQLDELVQIDSRFTGRGVNASSAYRITSQYMYDKLMTENTKTNYYGKLSNILGNVESLFAETEDSGLSSDINRYFQAIENLRSNPNSEIYRSNLKKQGSNLAESFQSLYSSIEKQQYDEKQEFYKNVEKTNDILKEIGTINQKLVDSNGQNNDLLDKRDQLELELSNYVDIKIDRSEGVYDLKISGKTAIFNTNVRTIDVAENQNSQIDKFNHIKYNPDNSFQIYDSIKYNADYTSKNIDTNDVVTYQLNNEFKVSVKIGEVIPDISKPKDPLTNNYPPLDINGDGNFEVTEDELVRALVYKINTNSDIKDSVTAYNGDYALDENGNKIIDNSKDNFLRIESVQKGISNRFNGQISIEKIDNTNSTILQGREVININTNESSTAESVLSIGILDDEVKLKTGILKAQIENLSSVSGNNKYQDYLDKLDTFVATLSDITDKYIKNGTDDYTYGENLSDAQFPGTINNIGLFSGSTVKTFKFDESAVDSLTQNKLDYLATIQWKKDFNFNEKTGDGTSVTKTSLLEYIRELKVSVSTNKEDAKFFNDTQKNVKLSIENSYNQLTKVDKDEELLNLMKFQATYTANAKIVTAIDEMIQTLLGLKR